MSDFKALARTGTRQAYEALVAALKRPGERVPAATVLLSYGWGKPVQTANVRVIASFADLSTEELQKLLDTPDDEIGRLIEGHAEPDEDPNGGTP